MREEVKVILQKARELLARPGGWTKGEYAKTANNSSTRIQEEDAYSFCVVGAVLRVMGESCLSNSVFAILEPMRVVGGFLHASQIVRFNDKQESVESVLSLFDKAIASLEAKP